jgi:hypothetical protein
MIGGNPNRLKKDSNLYTPPLVEYLNQHNIEENAYLEFIEAVQGKVVSPFSSEYETSRKESDNAFDKYPLLVVYCENVADVVLSIKFCRAQKIEICSRAGGHSTAGYSVLNGRLLIDVSLMKGIFVNPQEMTSIVGAGVQWGEYNYTLNAYGLHNPGGSCSSVGLTGYTLGGGYGYTSMHWGIACDNLLEVVMVTAKGEIITANKDHHPELLWAHQGGTGGNFGIVVSLKYQLYKLKDVWPIEVNWPIDDAAEVLKTWQDKMTKTLIDTKLGLLGFLATRQVSTISPSGETTLTNEPYFCIRGIYSGINSEDGKKALAPLLAIGNPSFPSGQLWKKTIPYAYANEHLLDNVEGVIPDTIKETKRCAYVRKSLSCAQFQQIVDYFKTSPNLYNIVSMEPYGGAINEKKPDQTAFVHRDAFFDIFVDSFWLEENEKKKAFQWLSNYFESTAMKDLWSDSYYQNYPNSEYKNWQNGYFGSNYQKLREVKTKWDQNNVFHFEQSIELL